MKKVLSVILAIVMTFSVGVVAFADDAEYPDDLFVSVSANPIATNGVDEASVCVELDRETVSFDFESITMTFAGASDENKDDCDDYEKFSVSIDTDPVDDTNYFGCFKANSNMKTGLYFAIEFEMVYGNNKNDKVRYYYPDYADKDDDYKGVQIALTPDNENSVLYSNIFEYSTIQIINTKDYGNNEPGHILIDTNGNGRSWCNWGFNAPAGETVTLYADPDDGWEFVEWKVIRGNITIDDNTFTMPDDEVVIIGMYEDETKIKREIDVYSSGRGKASANVSKGVMGTKVKLTATPSEGYELKEWKVVYGDVKIEDNVFEIGSEDVRVKAVFKKAEAKVEEEVQEGTTEAEENPNTGAPVMGNVVALAMVATVAAVCTKRYF